ncbi:MAG: hypothetical protein SH808_11860 [Saprospiraceae bacterium]|nr:hypothetical protein [Saprospiraceae bacterium]
MIVFIILAETYHVQQIWKLALFAPTVYALSGFIQARYKFCFVFGFFGLLSMAGKRSRVKDADQLTKDRAMAFRILSQVIFGSSLITLLYYFLS